MKVNNTTKRLCNFKDIEVGDTFVIETNCYIKLGNCNDEDDYYFNAYNFNHNTFMEIEDDQVVVPVECELTVK